MAKVWIRCITMVRVDDAGTMQIYHPGDWCKVGKHQARQLVAQGSAEIPNMKTRMSTYELDGCSIVLYGGSTKTHKDLLQRDFPGVKIICGEPTLQTERVLLWDISFSLNTFLIPLGFNRLETGWQLCIPILDYDLLAENIGTQEERDYTKNIIHDLRVPVRDPRLIFVLNCEDTQNWFDCYKEECGEGKDKRLAYLRAFYKAKPITCDLPNTWLK